MSVRPATLNGSSPTAASGLTEMLLRHRPPLRVRDAGARVLAPAQASPPPVDGRYGRSLHDFPVHASWRDAAFSCDAGSLTQRTSARAVTVQHVGARRVVDSTPSWLKTRCRAGRAPDPRGGFPHVPVRGHAGYPRFPQEHGEAASMRLNGSSPFGACSCWFTALSRPPERIR